MALFIIFGVLALGAGLGMILQRNSVHAALLLVLHFFAISVIFLTLGAEFLMVSQIIVYAGAIMVLFLFVIMLLGVDRFEDLMAPRKVQVRQIGIGLLVAVVIAGGLLTAATSVVLLDEFPALPPEFGSAQAIGRLLFERYLLPFQVTGLLLLVAALGVLLLAKRTRS